MVALSIPSGHQRVPLRSRRLAMLLVALTTACGRLGFELVPGRASAQSPMGGAAVADVRGTVTVKQAPRSGSLR